MGWSNVLDHPYLEIVITQNITNVYPVIGTGDENLWPPSTPQPNVGGNYNGYVKVGNFELNDSIRMNLENGENILVSEQGRYDVRGSLSMRHSVNSAVTSFVFAVEVGGFLLFNSRPVKARLPNGDDPGNICGGGTLKSERGWKLSLWCASEKTGTILIDTADISVRRFTAGI